MAGLYIHIPFCRSRCTYCAFYSTTLLDLRQRYVDAVCREMESIASLPSKKMGSIETVYFGGGTPSQLTVRQLEQLFLYINKVYRLPLSLEGDGRRLEVTIECNPDDVTEEYAEALSQLPINRVSMGAQTFDDQRLRFLNRRHTTQQVTKAVERLRRAGILNISIDLMYGFPGESLSDWERDIDAAIALNVEHLSAYCLMIEEGTVLYEMIKTPSDSPCLGGELKSSLDREDLGGSEELERAMYELLTDRLAAAGYEHYEISNFAKHGYRSQHNSSYWNDVPYIGLGAAAHSYDGHHRSWNIADLKEYIRRVENGQSPIEDSEEIVGWTRYNDRITVALRTCEGLDLTTLPDEQRDYCMKNARRFLDDGLLKLDGSRIVLTRKGLFVSDMVMSELMNV